MSDTKQVEEIEKENGVDGETQKAKEKAKRVKVSQDDLPRITLEEAIPVSRAMYNNVAAGSISFDDLAKLLGTSPSNTKTKYAIWGAEAYGIILKDEQKEYMLSETGRKIVAPTYHGEDSEAKIKAILTPTILSKFFAEYNKHPIPEENYFANLLETKLKVPRDRTEEAKKVILSNANFTGIIKKDVKTGKEIVDLEDTNSNVTIKEDSVQDAPENGSEVINDNNDNPKLDSTCFVICPIGEEGSIERKHSDMMLRHLIQPVLENYKFSVIRADKIEKSGLITQQILEHLVKARLCIADLSFSNPNVFYELGVRHMSQLAAIQIIRKGDKLPFDVSQGRTITIDTSDVYTLLDRMESARKELSEYIKGIVNNVNSDVSDDNPIKVYLLGIKVIIPK